MKCKIVRMNELTKQKMADSIRSFRLPRYAELPDTGLYLEQTVQYINQYLEPIGWPLLTTSMVSNYVKNDVIAGPVKKQYYAVQIAHLMAIAFMKGVITLENICRLFQMQKEVYTDQVAYDYFCSELENMLFYSFGIRDDIKEIGVTESDEKTMLRGVIIAVSHLIYLNQCFQAIYDEKK